MVASACKFARNGREVALEVNKIGGNTDARKHRPLARAVPSVGDLGRFQTPRHYYQPQRADSARICSDGCQHVFHISFPQMPKKLRPLLAPEGRGNTLLSSAFLSNNLQQDFNFTINEKLSLTLILQGLVIITIHRFKLLKIT